MKGGEGECFRIENGVRQGYIMSPWLFNVYMDAVMKEVKVRNEEDGSEAYGGGKRVEIT